MEAGQLDDGRLEDGRSEIGQCEARRPEAGPEEVDRLYAIRVLSAIGSHAGAAVPALINLLTAETDPLYRRAITRALVEIAGSDLGAETGEVVVCGENDVSGADKESGAGVHSVLAALADDTDDDVRRIARTALGLEVEAGSADPVPAFPGAEGFGMWTRGGRGGDIMS